MAPSDRGWEQIRIGVALTAIAGVTLALRFVARFVRGLKLEIDDWLALTSFVFIIGMLIELILWATIGGSGRHFTELLQNPPELERFFKIFLSNEFTYGVTSPLVKLTIIAFYRRVFAVKPFQMICNIVAGLSISWGVIVVIVSGLQCQPLARYWNPIGNPGTCINTIAFVQGVQGYNIFLDLVILVMPLPIVWQLHRPLKDKLQLSAVFMLGGFIFAASIYRMVTLTQIDPMDLSYSIHTGVIWTFVEPCIGLACANLPIIKGMIPFLNSSKVSTGKHSVSNIYGARTPFASHGGHSAGAQYHHMESAERVGAEENGVPLANLKDEKSNTSNIHVKTTVEVNSS